MKKITKANAKKFNKAIISMMEKFGAVEVPPITSSMEKAWRMRTIGGPLNVSLRTESEQELSYALFCKYEDPAKAKGWADGYTKGRLNPHSGKWNFHYSASDDLTEVLKQIKNELHMMHLKVYKIRAEVHTDDRNVEVNFNAIEWFDQATDDQIRNLAQCDYGGDYPADVVAQYMADHDKGVEDLFTYIRLMAGKKNSPGFEVHVNANDVTKYLKENRLELYLSDFDEKEIA